jgi:peptidylprolyl isomerase
MSEDDKPSVKAKLPNAREISRKDFTPHGIKSKGGSKPSGLTAAAARKRRRVVIAVATVVVVVGAGVGTYVATRPGPKITVTGAYGKAAKLHIPKDMPQPKKLVKTVVSRGSGQKVQKSDFTTVTMDIYDWAHSKYKLKPLGKSLGTGQIGALQIGSDQSMAVAENALIGVPAGSRVMVQVPVADTTLGAQGNPQAGIAGSDTLVFLFDLQSTFNAKTGVPGKMTPQTDPKLPTVTDGGPGKAPNVTIPKNDPPADLKVIPLIQGTGRAAAKNDTLFMQYTGVNWRTGKVFDSSWGKQVFPLQGLGSGSVIPGWDKGLVGQKAGSRLMLVIPAKDGYGTKGNSGAGISGTDTLVFVVDILAVLPPTQQSGS